MALPAIQAAAWYLAVLGSGNRERTFLGPENLAEMEAFGKLLLYRFPFQKVNNYVASIRDWEGREIPTTTYVVER